MMTPMVRLNETGGESAAVSRIELAGASPAQVSAGAPGSRLQPSVERPEARAECRKPGSARGQSSGPQREVNAEQASSDYQPKGVRESRAAHVTAKATDIVLDPERTMALSGVLATARCDSWMRNRRGPTRWSTSGQPARIRERPKKRGAGRESEGVTVPWKTWKHVGGIDPCFGHAERAGKCEGMVSTHGIQ